MTLQEKSMDELKNLLFKAVILRDDNMLTQVIEAINNKLDTIKL